MQLRWIPLTSEAIHQPGPCDTSLIIGSFGEGVAFTKENRQDRAHD